MPTHRPISSKVAVPSIRGDVKRSAEDTIKGFNYQFAATVLLILESKNNSQITIEGIEDIDVSGASMTAAVQCKYYEGTKLTNSVLRDIVKPMMENDKSRSSKINYFIYGHFKDQVTFPLTDPKLFRDEVLCYTTGKGSAQKKGNVADDIGFTNAEIESFLKRLSFRYTQDYEAHKRGVEAALEKQFSCSFVEVTSFYYPVAVSKVAEIATKATPAERTITKTAFLKAFASKQQLFRHWLLYEKGEDVFCKAMRRSFFSPINIGPSARFFVIECGGSESVIELKEVAIAVRSKWSSHKRSLKQALKDRYAPYLLFRNASAQTIAALLRELHLENIKLVDGFPFKDAAFSFVHISQPQTVENSISLRVLYDENELSRLLAELNQTTKEIFEFYRGNPLPLNEIIQHIQIPISSITSLSKII
ncbi:hypothetical protein OpiT1DRAFT_03816 [Opitutaceae bacterium TAV1]|nr:hypothetical protein OpiT1DRAFT_03816 [Opitutaceae bacterium TAV1]